jgi:FdhE protein
VKVPESLILPDPQMRFARTAARLESLSTGHPLGQWLIFMAQHAAADALASRSTCLDHGLVEQALIKGVPPLASLGDRRDASWRDDLRMLLDRGEREATPAPAREAIAPLRTLEAQQIEVIADDFLYASIDGPDVGLGFYVAAALQVHFTQLAARLPASSLRLPPERGRCPCCGSTPVSGVVTDAGRSSGVRYLYCSLCGTAWSHVRAACITCGQSRSVVLRAIDGESDVKAETCDECQTYSKMLYRTRNADLDPFADDLATLPLDVAVSDAGWSRYAPNPLLLVGSRTSGWRRSKA